MCEYRRLTDRAPPFKDLHESYRLVRVAMNLKYIFIITLWLATGGSGIAEVRQEGTEDTQVSQQKFYQTDVV